MKKQYILIPLSLFFARADAQQGIVNNGNLQVHPGGNLSAALHFTNANTAVLANNGNIYLQGHITNNEAGMSQGSGTLYLNGASAQTLTGTSMMRTNNLITNNAAGITLQNDLSVAGTHTFTSGLIASSATPHYLVYENGASHSGSNDARHVTGWVKKNGNGNFSFPVGDNNYLRSISISGLSAVSEFNCHYYTPTPNVFNLTSPIVKVKPNEYWQLDKISGGSAIMTMNWDHSKVVMDNVVLEDVVTGRYNGSNWVDAGGTPTGDVTTTGSVVSSAQTLFGRVTIAYKSFPIPLRLLSFTGWRRSGTSYLHWVTENEMDVDRFSIERSFDGTSFTAIGNVPARNNGIRELYSFQDPVSFTGTIYYRLCSYDRDGTFSYSRWIAVTENGNDRSAFLVLNPARTAVTVFNRSGSGGLYNYNLYNQAGQLILKGSISLNANSAGMIRLPMHVAAGIYSLELTNDRTRFLQQVLIER